MIEHRHCWIVNDIKEDIFESTESKAKEGNYLRITTTYCMSLLVWSCNLALFFLFE